MKCPLGNEELVRLIARQLESLFGCSDNDKNLLPSVVALALESCTACFAKGRNKYYRLDGDIHFSPFNADQYAIFLYWVARHAFTRFGSDQASFCDRVYYLNKALNSVDIYYEVQMPVLFTVDHPVGSVIGRACYGAGFSFSQNCTVGNSKDSFPSLGENVILLSGSKILGNCKLGNNVLVSASTYLLDTSVPDNSLVFGRPRDYVVKKMSDDYFEAFRTFNP